MIVKYHLKIIPNEILTYLRSTYNDKISFFDICEIANDIGFDSVGVEVSFEELNTIVPFPCIIYWKNTHFLVVYKIEENNVYIADPASGLFCIKKNVFYEGWLSNVNTGKVLAIEPS